MSQQHRNVIAVNIPNLDHTTNGEIRVYWMTVRGAVLCSQSDLVCDTSIFNTGLKNCS